MATTGGPLMNTEPWKDQPACNICNTQHAGYERAHTESGDDKDYSANFPDDSGE
jgi:hypothetical protein